VSETEKPKKRQSNTLLYVLVILSMSTSGGALGYDTILGERLVPEDRTDDIQQHQIDTIIQTTIPGTIQMITEHSHETLPHSHDLPLHSHDNDVVGDHSHPFQDHSHSLESHSHSLEEHTHPELRLVDTSHSHTNLAHDIEDLQEDHIKDTVDLDDRVDELEDEIRDLKRDIRDLENAEDHNHNDILDEIQGIKNYLDEMCLRVLSEKTCGGFADTHLNT